MDSPLVLFEDCIACMNLHALIRSHQCPFLLVCVYVASGNNQFFWNFNVQFNSTWTKMLAKEANNTEDRLVGWWWKVIQHTARLHSTSQFLHSTRGHINHVDCTQWHPSCVCHTSTFWRCAYCCTDGQWCKLSPRQPRNKNLAEQRLAPLILLFDSTLCLAEDTPFR